MAKNICKIDDLITRVNEEPKLNYVWGGIKEQTLNFIVAPAKVGKTTFCENLGMSIAAGCSEFMNSPLSVCENKKVLFLGFEEFYSNRTFRNIKQIKHLDSIVGNEDWHNNIFVIDGDSTSLRYIESKKHWDWVKQAIKDVAPRVVIIDSLSRLHTGQSIEDSVVAIQIAKDLRNIVDETDVTLFVIHHTSKLQNERLSLSNMAGSRILGQEGDAIIGLNKTPLGQKYIKPLAYRYADDYSETVQVFTINEHGWLVPGIKINEEKILKESDNRTDNTNKDLVSDFFLDFTKGDISILIETKNLMEEFVETRIMSKPSLHVCLKKLIEDNIIQKQEKGSYTLLQT